MDKLKIYIDRLKSGDAEKLDITLPPDFLEVEEEDLAFVEPVRVFGETYIANDHLVISLSIDTSAFIPCSVCNEAVRIPLELRNIYLTKPLEEIKGVVFDLAEEVRESLLLQVPLFTECQSGKCPEREQLKKFMKEIPEGVIAPSASEDVVHFPFADLDS
jgi:uncharacterized metal-binding protein YceD (DUF177 family)